MKYTVEKIMNYERLETLYEDYEQLIKKILDENPFKAGSVNIVENELGFPTYFRKNDKSTIQNKFIERIFVFKKDNDQFIVDNEVNFKNFSLEELLNNSSTSFKFIFEGKAYYLKNDPVYLEKLINEGYLSKNFLENVRKRYEKYLKNGQKEYYSFDEFVEKVTIP